MTVVVVVRAPPPLVDEVTAAIKIRPLCMEIKTNEDYPGETQKKGLVPVKLMGELIRYIWVYGQLQMELDAIKSFNWGDWGQNNLLPLITQTG